MNVIVTATFNAREGHEQELLEALKASLPAVHDEPGCIRFALHISESGSPVLVEKWESDELLEIHLAGEPVAALVDRIQPHVAEDPQVVRLSPVPVGTTGRGTL
jgi:quinol monooxygenase YgiN